MSSTYYNEFRADKRVRWNRDKTIKFMCPCVRPPRKEVCVDPIKGNAKFVARALRRVLLDKQKTAGAQGTRGGVVRNEFIDITKDEYTFAAWTMCKPVEVEGMDLRGVKLTTVQRSCAAGLCGRCGVPQVLNEKLNVKSLQISPLTTFPMERFEMVPRPHKKNPEHKVLELVKKQVTFKELLGVVEDTIGLYRLHCLKDRWRRRVVNRIRESLPLDTGLASVDYASGLNFCSMESITCVSDNHGYNEVFVVNIKRRRVGGEGDAGFEIFTTLVFFFFGKASSTYKDNDVAAHEVHEKEVLRILREEHGITKVVQVSDGCKGMLQRLFLSFSLLPSPLLSRFEGAASIISGSFSSVFHVLTFPLLLTFFSLLSPSLPPPLRSYLCSSSFSSSRSVPEQSAHREYSVPEECGRRNGFGAHFY